MAVYSFSNRALQRFHETLKDAIDPNGILSAGRYAIWPKHLRRGQAMTLQQPLRCQLPALSGALAAVISTPALAELPQVRPRRAVYEKWCSACHDPGVTHPGTHPLITKYKGVKSGVLLEWTDLPAPLVTFIIRHGISVMPQFRKTEISNAELDSLAACLSRNTK